MCSGLPDPGFMLMQTQSPRDSYSTGFANIRHLGLGLGLGVGLGLGLALGLALGLG